MTHLFFLEARCTTFGIAALKLLHGQWGTQYVPQIFRTLPKCGELVAAMELSPHDDSAKIHIHLYRFSCFLFSSNIPSTISISRPLHYIRFLKWTTYKVKLIFFSISRLPFQSVNLAPVTVEGTCGECKILFDSSYTGPKKDSDELLHGNRSSKRAVLSCEASARQLDIFWLKETTWNLADRCSPVPTASSVVLSIPTPVSFSVICRVCPWSNETGSGKKDLTDPISTYHLKFSKLFPWAIQHDSDAAISGLHQPWCNPSELIPVPKAQEKPEK